MSNLADYFARRDADLPKPKYNYGDRVWARWNGIPVIASVIREQEGSVLVQTDLPVKHNNEIHNILSIAVKDLKRLKSYDDV